MLRGNCTFTEKALLAQEAMAAMLIVVYDSESVSSPQLNSSVTIPVLMVDNETGQLILVSVCRPKLINDHYGWVDGLLVLADAIFCPPCMLAWKKINWHLSLNRPVNLRLRGHNLSQESSISKLDIPLGCSNIYLSDGVLKRPIAFWSKCSHFRGKTMDYKWVKLSKFGHSGNFELNIPADKVFSGLSEIHKLDQQN